MTSGARLPGIPAGDTADREPRTGEYVPKGEGTGAPDFDAMQGDLDAMKRGAAALAAQYDADEYQRAQAERFLTLLDEKAAAFCFQTFDDDKSRKAGRLCRVLHGSLNLLGGTVPPE